jgi:hypothetical protein
MRPQLMLHTCYNTYCSNVWSRVNGSLGVQQPLSASYLLWHLEHQVTLALLDSCLHGQCLLKALVPNYVTPGLLLGGC